MKLIEDKRSELVVKSKRGQREKGDGKTRYEKRLKSKISSSNREYNQINMDNLFKNGILTVKIPVVGETSNYLVTIKFGGVLDLIRQRLSQQASSNIDLRTIIRALIDAFNTDDVYIHCSCEDWKYRMAYFASISDINAGEIENRPSKVTNPNNNLGPGCKHVMLVLSNTTWIIKVASVIMNYIKYMERNKKADYARIIYPSIYGKSYKEPVQTSIFDKEDGSLDTSSDIIDTANIDARRRGQFQKNNPYRFQKKIPSNGEQETLELELEED